MNDILNTITAQLKLSHDKLIGFANTGYSYEEWINWELFHAFTQKGYSCCPKPSYKYHGQPFDLNFQADLHCKNECTHEEFIVEVALVGDYTQNKWRDKIERDRWKLNEFLPTNKNLKKIQIVVLVADYADLLTEWDYWLKELKFWLDIPPTAATNSTAKGEVVVCAWELPSTALS